jgi:hypothetical protein
LYLTELDEALDISCLNIPAAMTGANELRIKLLAQRGFIRELLHMFRNIKEQSTDNKAVA